MFLTRLKNSANTRHFCLSSNLALSVFYRYANQRHGDNEMLKNTITNTSNRQAIKMNTEVK